MPPQIFIKCENLVKIYKIGIDGEHSSDASLEVQALQGLDLNVNEGEMIGIVGASGSGKTTLLNILGGLDRPTGGRAVVIGKDLGRMSQRGLNQYRRQTVGFVWQYGTRNLIPYLTALENIQLPMTLSGKVGKKPHQRAAELLNLVGLNERMEHRLDELSGGEQQRVAVAIALANQPRLLLADEPTGELDTATAKTIYDLLRDLNLKMGLTIVIVSHDPGIAQHVDRVVSVRDGKLASETLRVRSSADDVHQTGKLHTFEELVLLDSAGRITLPHDYLEHFNIKRRVRLEINEDGILIRPPKIADGNTEHADVSPEDVDSVKKNINEQAEPACFGRSMKLLKTLSAKFHFHIPSQRKRSEEDNHEGEL